MRLPSRSLLLLLSPCASLLAQDSSSSALVQRGTFLAASINATATFGDQTLALSHDPDGLEILPTVPVLLPERADDRFVLEWTEKTSTFVLTSLPAEDRPAEGADWTGPLPFALRDRTSSETLQADASLTVSALQIVQRLSFGYAASRLQLELILTNTGGQPLTGLRYLRAFNPDPDLELRGLTTTLDSIVQTAGGPLAMATGPDSGRTLALGVLETSAQVGFCYRCSSPDSSPFDSGGREEDWDLVALLELEELLPGATSRFHLILTVGSTPELALALWEENLDADEDSFSPEQGDCDDTISAISPAGIESCDGLDQNCNGILDEHTECFDDDGDGFSEQFGDCDDAHAGVYPGAPEGVDLAQNETLESDGIDNDCDGIIDNGTSGHDDDGDGFWETNGDCDDTCSDIYPGADEVYYNAIDEDCNGSDLTDQDNDGFNSILAGGIDCDDLNSHRSPGEIEVLNAIDDDCDGLADEGLLPRGAVVITEILADPQAVPDRQGEFLELHNVSRDTINLAGWVLTNANGQQLALSVPDGTLLLAPGDYLLLAASEDSGENGQLSPDVGLHDFILANASDRIGLNLGNLEIDAVAYDGGHTFPDPTGASIQLSPDCLEADPSSAHVANDDGACWCISPERWTPTSDFGSPGETNPACPGPPPDDADGDGVNGPLLAGDDCDDTNPLVYPGADEQAYDGIDQDCDGSDLVDLDGDGFVASQVGGADCKDTDTSIYPGATELPLDGIDQDCNGKDSFDADGDGTDALEAGGSDCDDSNPTVYPGAPEDGGSGSARGDGLDSDCDGIIDNDTLDFDDDGDGFSELVGDCADDDPSRSPAEEEVFNGLDDDCDGTIDSPWRDDDGDGYSEVEGDCNDRDPRSSPHREETADDIDNDCDGIVDEETTLDDQDGDGFSPEQGDCDDLYADIHPGAGEICDDGIDQNCSGQADEDCDAAGCGGCQTGPAFPPWTGGIFLLLFTGGWLRTWLRSHPPDVQRT